MLKNFKNKIKSDNGFMGHTHAISAIAFYLLIVLFWRQGILNLGLSNNTFILFLTSIVIAGAALLPDLDNVKSTALSVLGPIGQLLSEIMRGTSTIIFQLTRTKYDEKNADPHRGFWHTLISSFVIGFVVHTLVSIDIKVNNVLSSYGFNTVGDYLALLWIFITVQLAFSGLFNSVVKKYNKSIIGKLTLLLVGTIISFILIKYNTTDNYNWLTVSIILGYIFHILGDTLTVAGTPILFPFKFKGKRWFTHRILKIRAGGEIENLLLLPLFSIIALICSILILFGGI